jgi:hypothetical protein
MKEIFLSRARDIFLFDCQAAGFDSQAIGTYRQVLSSFIRFTGDIQVQDLTLDHVRMYVANLSDGPNEGDEHDELVMSHYTMIHAWAHWMYSQKAINERTSALVKTPHLASLFPLQFPRRMMDPYAV